MYVKGNCDNIVDKTNVHGLKWDFVRAGKIGKNDYKKRGSKMIIRPRRLRKCDTLRRMVRETRVDKSSLIYPMFVKEGVDIVEEIPTMPGQFRYSVDTIG